jgi:hypothetical protein
MSSPFLLDPALRKAIDDYIATIADGLPDVTFITKMGLKGTTLTIKFGCLGLNPEEDKAELNFAREPNTPIQELEIANLILQAIGAFLGQVLIAKLRLAELGNKPKIHVP